MGDWKTFSKRKELLNSKAATSGLYTRLTESPYEIEKLIVYFKENPDKLEEIITSLRIDKIKKILKKW